MLSSIYTNMKVESSNSDVSLPLVGSGRSGNYALGRVSHRSGNALIMHTKGRKLLNKP